MSAVGKATITAPAITTFQSTENEPERLFKATVTGCALGLGKMVTPKRKSFQMLVNWKMATTTKAGKANGNITKRKVRMTPAPSIRAASTSSSGILAKKFRKIREQMGRP